MSHSPKDSWSNRILPLSSGKMVDFEVTVFTANIDYAGTLNNVYIELVGTDGNSERELLMDYLRTWNFIRGAVSSFTVPCPVSIGKLIQIKLDKPRFLFFEDNWFPKKVEVKSPEGDTYNFPIYRWINDSEVHCFREGTALTACKDPHSKTIREQEIKQRESDYCWHDHAEGLPHCMKADSLFSLPSALRFSYTKDIELAFTLGTGLIELKLEGVADSVDDWTKIDDIKTVFPCRSTQIYDYAEEHWKEDAFFGYQFLNGVNPMLIRRCSTLPKNFPVTDEMVFSRGPYTLAEEMKKGNIFLCDFKLLDGLKANIIKEKQQYMTAPLVLLHKTPDDKLMPLAIQLKQTPGEDNPIFLPTDSEYDWLMAKIFVRSADFNLHQLNVHLLRTHLLAEVFTVSLMRNIPMVHPLHKLLLAHTWDTLEINYLARNQLISKNGTYTEFAAAGGEDMMKLLKRSLSSLTYSSLCIPEDITERGLQTVPNFYYRDDGLELWGIIQRFVERMLKFYYNNDAEVKKDSELQKWISDIFKHGFLSKVSSGIPQRFTTVEELVKFVTMVIFTCSGQHSAVNSGQYDYGGWMPNSPSTMQRPPPTRKGKTNQDTMLQTLPNKGVTANAMAALWLLSKSSSDYVPLGQYPEAHFNETNPCELIKHFQGMLQALSANIKIRNLPLKVPYTYMDPEKVENSVAI
ncbi:arachidonate 15-lipoxygenase B-like [Trematomus bernacchii]|uniref:arachidonate 15-lipoxygenase B-like n=1 Tax=Trematomus bernacchii TaxID=40690 RepID=UPI00146B187D|nr:arachidonate 15-lipoxygenase B-like [Trematomus bernacchii]